MKQPGGARREDLFDQRERAVLRFATLLTAHPGGVEQRDLDELDPYLQGGGVRAGGNDRHRQLDHRYNDGLQTPLG